MRVGEGAFCRMDRCGTALRAFAHAVRLIRVGTARRRAFAHPHMGRLESSTLIGWVGVGEAAVRGAMRSAARRRGRYALGVASGAC